MACARRCRVGSAVLVALPWLVSAAPVAAFTVDVSSGRGAGSRSVRRPCRARASARWEAWPGWRESGTPKRYRARGQHFSRVVATVVLLGVVGARTSRRRRVDRAAVPLLMLAAAAVVVPALMATGPGLAFVEAAVRALPGLGVVRDAQKWVALAVPGYALAARRPSSRCGAGFRPRAGRTALICCAAVIPVAARPGVGSRGQGVRGAVPAGVGDGHGA